LGFLVVLGSIGLIIKSQQSQSPKTSTDDIRYLRENFNIVVRIFARLGGQANAMKNSFCVDLGSKDTQLCGPEAKVTSRLVEIADALVVLVIVVCHGEAYASALQIPKRYGQYVDILLSVG
jgi:hypothetical protein